LSRRIVLGARLWLTIALFVGVATPLHSQSVWRDTTHHSARFVTVQRGVKLHVLDFGGTGAPLVFLAGLGNTAHSFDEFAPAFTDRFHVIAITRRGFGESDHPESGYDTPRLVADVKAVLDSLKLTRVSLVGHSIAGEEITRFAATYPARVDKLVYLDGAYDRVRAAMLITDDSVPAPAGESVPPPAGKDTLTEAAYVTYVHRSRGVAIPEADIRMRFRHDGWREEVSHAYQSISVEPPQYKRVKAPALAIYAVDDSSDELYALLRQQFRDEVTNGQVVELHGAHHWIFISNRAECLMAMRRFLSSP
jgi:pimeloyl-ACP methyl ester carboxylesterase